MFMFMDHTASTLESNSDQILSLRRHPMDRITYVHTQIREQSCYQSLRKAPTSPAYRGLAGEISTTPGKVVSLDGSRNALIFQMSTLCVCV